MDAPLTHVSSHSQGQQPYPFLANNVWADSRKRPSHWLWFVIALLAGAALAVIVTHWDELPFFRSNAARKEPKQLPTTVAATPIKKMESTETSTKTVKEPDAILQADRREAIPKPSSPELTVQTGIIRLPPLSVLKIYFPKSYREKPVVKIMSETGMPSEVTIDDITVQCVVIRNAHQSNECYFRYYAEGKLKDEIAAKDRIP
ncbi:MAG TPA: hypothetical protein PLN21_10780 [Gemmatales bacterium]|nr:hypothetical protein [Gemmatales bacterium]